MAQILIITGAAIFGILGAIHLLYTFFTNNFDAYDSSVSEAMKTSSLVLTKETSMWKAWIGFNASHSLGAMLLAGVYIPLSWSYFDIIQQSTWLLLLPVVTGLSYIALAKLYWFRIPLIGTSISTVCFIVAALLIKV